jgi:glycosyltransferase involved in cell wall biosynthesis
MDRPQKGQKILSVIVPIGGFPNGSNQIRAWLDQSIGPEIEVILVNDSANQSTANEISEIVRDAPNVEIKVINSAARNPGGARNLGLINAAGKWVCFWDSDDVGMIEESIIAINQAQQESSDLIIGRYVIVDVDKDRHAIKEIDSAAPDLNDVYMNPGLWRFIMRLDNIATERFPDLRMGEDQVFAFTILQKARKIHFTGDLLYKYHRYPSLQLTKSKSAMDDLYSSLNLTTKLYMSQIDSSLNIAILRQSISVMRHCGVRHKVRALINLIRLATLKPRFLVRAPRALLKIVRRK